MLMAGNVAGTRAPLVVVRTRSLADALAAAPSEPGDLLQARLTPLRGLLAISLALIWIGSGVVSWLVPAARDEALLAGLHLSAGAALSVTRMGAALDIVLGAGLASQRLKRSAGSPNRLAISCCLTSQCRRAWTRWLALH
jgi:hypothetical protein